MIALLAWIVPLVAAAAVVVIVTVLVLRHRKAGCRRTRQRRVLDELEELEVENVEVLRQPEGRGAVEVLGEARLAHGRKGLSRLRTGFFVAPERADQWPTRPGYPALVRFELRGVRHELKCRVVSRARLTSRGRRRLGVDSQVLYRLVPRGLIVKRERRDMMRFFVGEDGSTKPRGFTDARRLVDMDAMIWATDLDSTGARRLPARLRADAYHVLDGGQTSAGPPPGGGITGGPGLAAEVLDFSGAGLHLECKSAEMASLLEVAGDEDLRDGLDRLADRALLVAVSVRFTFPPKVQDLQPPVAPLIWFLAEITRASVLEADDEDDYVLLGLAMLYQSLKLDEITGVPSRWSLVKRDGEADDLVAIHNALNQAAAQMDAGMLAALDLPAN